MLLDLTTIESISQADLTGLPSKTLLRRFGQDNDSIELTIYDINNNIIDDGIEIYIFIDL